MPCASIALWNGLIIAGYISGLIRLFDLTSGIIKVEICAHSRCVNALDVAAESVLVCYVKFKIYPTEFWPIRIE